STKNSSGHDNPQPKPAEQDDFPSRLRFSAVSSRTTASTELKLGFPNRRARSARRAPRLSFPRAMSADSEPCTSSLRPPYLFHFDNHRIDSMLVQHASR